VFVCCLCMCVKIKIKIKIHGQSAATRVLVSFVSAPLFNHSKPFLLQFPGPVECSSSLANSHSRFVSEEFIIVRFSSRKNLQAQNDMSALTVEPLLVGCAMEWVLWLRPLPFLLSYQREVKPPRGNQTLSFFAGAMTLQFLDPWSGFVVPFLYF